MNRNRNCRSPAATNPLKVMGGKNIAIEIAIGIGVEIYNVSSIQYIGYESVRRDIRPPWGTFDTDSDFDS